MKSLDSGYIQFNILWRIPTEDMQEGITGKPKDISSTVKAKNRTYRAVYDHSHVSGGGCESYQHEDAVYRCG